MTIESLSGLDTCDTAGRARSMKPPPLHPVNDPAPVIDFRAIAAARGRRARGLT